MGKQARYFFKHALIQDTAYQSLLKSTRQQYHQQIARVLEERFPDTKETQPELLAHHYTEANLIEQAIPYWQQAGQRAIERSANAEAISHLTKGVKLVLTLPDTPDRASRELALQLLRAVPLIASEGYAVDEVRQTYERAQVLCEQIKEPSQLFRAVWGLTLFYTNTGDNRTSYKFATRCLELAEQARNPVLLLQSHMFVGSLLHWFGEFPAAATHLARAVALYEFERDHRLGFIYGLDPAVASLGYGSVTRWLLGYPDQARQQAHKALRLAEQVRHPFSRCFALSFVIYVHLFIGRRVQLVHRRFRYERFARGEGIVRRIGLVIANKNSVLS
jgi:tetratricopeptide (TPR) repeat protein